MNGLDDITELHAEYDGLSGNLTAQTGEPAPLAEDDNPPELKPVNLPEEVKIPEETGNYDTAEKLRWLVLILFLAVPFVAAVVFLILGQKIVFLICAGCFVVILPVFFIIHLTRERNDIIGKGIVGKPDTRQIEAQIVSCVYVTRKFHDYKTNGVLLKREVVDVTYKTVITDGRNNYIAKTKIFYYPREEVEAYVRGKRAYIDSANPKNQREVKND